MPLYAILHFNRHFTLSSFSSIIYSDTKTKGAWNMGAKKLIKSTMIHKDLKVGYVAEQIGVNSRVLSTQLNRDVMNFSRVEAIAEALGCRIVFEDIKTGEIYR